MWLTIKPKLQVAHIAHPTIEPSKWHLKHIRNIYQTQGRATSATPGFRHFLCLSILSTNRRLHWSTELILQLSPIHIRHPWAILKQLAAVRKLISKIKVSPFYDANWKRPFFRSPSTNIYNRQHSRVQNPQGNANNMACCRHAPRANAKKNTTNNLTIWRHAPHSLSPEKKWHVPGSQQVRMDSSLGHDKEIE